MRRGVHADTMIGDDVASIGVIAICFPQAPKPELNAATNS
jgi:hypothetical protein